MTNLIQQLSSPISMMDLRRQAGELLNNVFYGKKTFLIQRSGEAMAVLLPISEYEQYLRQQEEARHSLAQKIEIVRQQIASSGVSEEELRSVIESAIQEVRSETR